MITEKNQDKVRKFYEVMAKMQVPPAKKIGLLAVKKETLADVSALAPNPNLVTSFDLTRETDSQEMIEELAKTITAGRIALLCLHDWLDPQIYNQLYLLSKNGRMEYPRLEERIFVQATKEAVIILVSTDRELEKLNYDNLFDLVGLVERL